MSKANIKTDPQIEQMRVAGKLASQVLTMIEPFIKPGVTTDKLNDICHNYIVNELQCTPAPLNYKGFPKSVCTSVNHVVCHGIPGSKKLKKGDIINIDVTVIKDGYHGDTSKMFCVGPPSILAQRLIDVTYECLWLGIKAAYPGNHLGDIGHAIEQHAHKHNFSVVRDFCGHGIGTEFHEDEIQVLHFGRPGSGMLIEPGMTFTIEPMINAGKSKVKILPDGWTAVTSDRSLSAQWEHTLAIHQDGAEVLTLRPEETTA